MQDRLKFYVGGHWIDPITPKVREVINPANETVAGRVSLGSAADVNIAVEAARSAFKLYSQTSREERLALLKRIQTALRDRQKDLAAAISEEIGAPGWLAREVHAALGMVHAQISIDVLKNFEFVERIGGSTVRREPIGVCGLITPWNWPINQIAAKVLPALAVGCTVVLKPSELSPFSACIWAEVLNEAGVPAGVFNLVNGLGPDVGAAISKHPQIDMISFTGSTRAGIDVARRAARTVKRVTQELGGKSANIMLADANLESVVTAAVQGVMLNTGQTCSALTRLLVPHDLMAEVARVAAIAAEVVSIGPPADDPSMGPLVSRDQWNKVQNLIKRGIKEGGTIVAGGPGRPAGLNQGFYAKATVFTEITREMTIARKEVFGPVLVVIGYDSIDEAIEIANDSAYGLSAAVCGEDAATLERIVGCLRAGQVLVNGALPDLAAPFGGYKHSGNGREFGRHGFAEYLEVKTVTGLNNG